MDSSSLTAPLLADKPAELVLSGNVVIQSECKEWSGCVESSDEETNKVSRSKRRSNIKVTAERRSSRRATLQSTGGDFMTHRSSMRRRSSAASSRRGSFVPIMLPNCVVQVGKEWGALGDASSGESAVGNKMSQRMSTRMSHKMSMTRVASTRRRSVKAVLGGGALPVMTAAGEWGGQESSSDENVEEADGVQARRDRYAQMARRIEAQNQQGDALGDADEEAQNEAKKVEEAAATAFRKKLCFYCCFFFVLYNSIGVALLLLLTRGDAPVMVLCLAPPTIFMVALEIFLVHTDRDIMAKRATFLRQKDFARAAVYCVYCVVFLGCLFGYRLWRAYHYWHGYNFQRTFIEELDALDASRQVLADRSRWDSHYLLWAMPIVVSLTCVFSRGVSMDVPQVCFWLFVLVVATSSIVTQTLLYDYSASNWIRAQYGLVYDGFKWVKRSDDALQQFQRQHKWFRLTEVLGRMLVLAALSICIPQCRAGFTAVLLADYSLGLLCMCRVSGSSLKALVVSMPVLLVDLVRYVDEPGFALPGRRFSAWLRALRTLELIVAVASCSYFASNGSFDSLNPHSAWKGSNAFILLLLIVLSHSLHFAISRLSPLGQQRGDLFTAVLDGDLIAAEESLTFEGGCTINMALRDPTKQTALHFAAAKGSKEVVEFLLRQSADPAVADARGDTPLMIACKAGHLSVVESLLQPLDTETAVSLAPGGHSDDDNDDDDADESRTSSSSQEEMCARMTLSKRVRRATPDELLRQRNGLGESAASIARSLPKHQRQELLALLEPAEADVEGSHSPLGLPQSSLSKASHVSATSGNTSTSASMYMDVDIAGGEHLHVWVGPRPRNAIGEYAGLATFMFSRGIGDQLERLMETDRGAEVRFSRLRTEKTLGAGGFGKVIKVQDVSTGAVYAAKLQSKNKAAKQALREVEMLHANQHPLIIRLVQIFHTTVFYGILMEYCDLDLNKRIIEYGFSDSGQDRPEVVIGLPATLSARYCTCIMLALEYLHDRRIVFRDLKPENVLISSKIRCGCHEIDGDFAKLTDFGIARVIESALQPGQEEDVPSPKVQSMTMKAGTPAFMSSEALSGRDSVSSVDVAGFEWIIKRDWFGLGCCLLLMLLGERGGRRVMSGKHEVLLPPPSAEMFKILMESSDKELISDDAFDLLSKLLAEKARDRGDIRFLRSAPFLQGALVELEGQIGTE
eukprot:TRINITY_DN7962_c0_g3_i1.p1 TRINITY_DN7962_c0_g3~~TRINITY_DN7962_c0_g3_i1.p1  ORF type:complete len:1198 (-),score=186.10 TRINITY_DN7962_c0_g3_i1:60-3653(-)